MPSHTGGGSSGPLNKFDATGAPTVNNDTTEGYSIGSRWLDVTNDEAYICLDATDGAAVWVKSTAGLASEIVNTPAGNIAATNVQAAINELDTEKLAAASYDDATAAETTTGTSTTKYVSPDGLAGSDYGKRIIQVKVFDDATAATTGDGKVIFIIPVELNGYNLVDCEAYVTGASSSGALTVQIRNVTQAADMLSTAITIDQSENSSFTAATPPVIDASNDDVATGDLIAIDVDGAGTSAEGLGVVLSFQLP